MLKLFPTQYTKKDRAFSNSGDRFNPTYKLKVDKEGRFDLVPTGKIDVFERIQSYREQCDLKCILQRFLAGDQSALNKYPTIFGDFTEAPKSLAEYYQRIIDATDYFNGLSVDVKAQFNNSPSEFFASIGSEKFFKALGIDPNPKPEPVVSQDSEKGDVE